MPISKKEAYLKQIAIYLDGMDFQSAYALASEFAVAYGNELLPNFLLAKSAFRLGRLAEAEVAARKAFVFAESPDDKVSCALLVCSICYIRKEYEDGFRILSSLLPTAVQGNDEYEKLMLLFSLALNEGECAIRHLETLYKINPAAASDLAVRVLSGSPMAFTPKPVSKA